MFSPLQLLPAFLYGLLVVAPFAASAARQKGILATDVERHAYVDLETALWSTIETFDKDDALNAILQAHNNFTRDFLPVSLPGERDSNAFIVFEGIYEYKYLETYLRSLINLFEAYRKEIYAYAQARDRNERALTDMAETILTDGGQSFRVSKTMDEIENIMVKQSLYYRIMLVGRTVIGIDYKLN